MPGMLLTAKEEEAVLNGLAEQGAHVRQTKRGFLVQFPNGESGSISFQGDHRRVKNARGLVRRNGLRWPLDTTTPVPEKEAMPETTAPPTPAEQYRTEYADYLKAEPRSEILAAVEKFMQGRDVISIPALVTATGFSANPVTQALLRLGYLQESGYTQNGKGRLRMWHKAPIEALTKVTYTTARMPTGRMAAGVVSRTAEELKRDREDKRYERPEFHTAQPPFTPLDQVQEYRPSKPKPGDGFGPVRVSHISDRIAAVEPQNGADAPAPQPEPTVENGVNPEMTAAGEVVESVQPDTMAAKAEADEAMALAEQMEARAVEAERLYGEEHRELEALRLELQAAAELSERRAEKINELRVERDTVRAEVERRDRAISELQAEVERERARVARAEDMEPVIGLADADVWPVRWEELDSISEHSIATYRDMLKAMGLTAMLRRN